MDGFVKLIFAFWIIVIVGIVIAAIITNPWLLILAAVILFVVIAFWTKNRESNKNSPPVYHAVSKKVNRTGGGEEMKKIKEGLQKQILDGKVYLENHTKELSLLIEKHSSSANNYVEQVSNFFDHNFENPLLRADNDFYLWVDIGYLAYPFYQMANRLLLLAFKHDGLSQKENYGSNRDCFPYNRIFELTQFFINGLKQRILDADDWNDTYTLPTVLYYIVRNNIVKYFHDKYIDEIGYTNIADYCKHQNDEDVEYNRSLYTFYFLYSHDIYKPFKETFLSLCAQIKSEQEAQKRVDLEKSLFGRANEVGEDESSDEDSPEALPIKPIERIDVMDGGEFEIFMEKYFAQKGYKVSKTPLSGDYGIDLIIEHEFGKTGVQLKRYTEKVGLAAVQEVVAGLKHYGLSNGMIITNSYYQPSAKQLAADNNITLWDRDILIEKLEE